MKRDNGNGQAQEDAWEERLYKRIVNDCRVVQCAYGPGGLPGPITGEERAELAAFAARHGKALVG